jgi:hypothetical protein
MPIDFNKVFALTISPELREECLRFFCQFKEFSNPDELRAFTYVQGLELVHKHIPNSNDLDYTILFTKLMQTGRSPLEPALFDLLDLLALRYREEDFKRQQCHELKEKIRNELIQYGSQEQAKDYQTLLERAAVSGRHGVGGKAAPWIEEVGDDLDELALRITLAVFSGTTFEVIERAKNDLVELLRPLVPTVKVEDPPVVLKNIPLMRRIQKAGATETGGTAPSWKRAIELKKEQQDFAREAIGYVWQIYRENNWRRALIEWLSCYAVGGASDVRTRAAVAVGSLAVQDYRYVRDNVLARWIAASGEDDRKAGEYRMAVGMALGVIVLDPAWSAEVQNLVRRWSQSSDRSERWVAVRAFIYVGVHWRPISEVIDQWHKIAATELPAIGVEAQGQALIRLNPLHMSLMDAMMRFFLILMQGLNGDNHEPFVGILQGLGNWIASTRADAAMGVFMFTTLGQIRLSTSGSIESADSPPLLLHLVEEQSTQSDYGKQLAELFNVLMSDVETIIEARDLLCIWAGWVNGLQHNRQSYEIRLQNLLKDIIVADKSGRMRGRLINSLRDCGRNNTLDRVLSSL